MQFARKSALILVLSQFLLRLLVPEDLLQWCRVLVPQRWRLRRGSNLRRRRLLLLWKVPPSASSVKPKELPPAPPAKVSGRETQKVIQGFKRRSGGAKHKKKNDPNQWNCQKMIQTSENAVVSAIDATCWFRICDWWIWCDFLSGGFNTLPFSKKLLGVTHGEGKTEKGVARFPCFFSG